VSEQTAGFGLEFICALGLEPVRFVELAGKLGCRAIGLAPSPITGPLGSDPEWSLRGEPARVATLKKALADSGVRVSLGEGFIIMPDRDIADTEADFDLMAELGAERLNACAMDPHPARNLDQFAVFATMAADRGLPVTIEFMPHTPVPDLAAAITFVSDSGARNAGVLVDAMHLFCSGGTADALRGVSEGMVTYAQLCDAKHDRFYDGYFQDARDERPLPGEGVLPLAQFLAALPAGCPIGIEAPMTARGKAGMRHEERFAAILTAAQAVTVTA